MDAHVVVVIRERYAHTAERLAEVVAATPGDVPVTLVQGALPRRERRRIHAELGDRVELLGPHRHLGPNDARALGLAHSAATYVAFIDNDVTPQPGWLEQLVEAAERRDAWITRPVILQASSGGVAVHDVGGDCHLADQGGRRVLIETHRCFQRPLDELPSLTEEPVELFEFHCALVHRPRLVALGGFDLGLRSAAEHLDLSLRIQAAGGSVWLVPGAQVTYQVPEGLGLGDLPFFLGRWSPRWTDESRDTFCAAHGVDPTVDPSFTWAYPELHRSYAWIPLGRLAAAAARRGSSRGAARRFEQLAGRHLAAAALRVDPRWRGDGRAAQPGRVSPMRGSRSRSRSSSSASRPSATSGSTPEP